MLPEQIMKCPTPVGGCFTEFWEPREATPGGPLGRRQRSAGEGHRWCRQTSNFAVTIIPRPGYRTWHR